MVYAKLKTDQCTNLAAAPAEVILTDLSPQAVCPPLALSPERGHDVSRRSNEGFKEGTKPPTPPACFVQRETFRALDAKCD